MNHRERALRSLDGLSIGDAFGERVSAGRPGAIIRRELPEGPWPWTDDTHMALSIVESLLAEGEINSDALMKRFIRRYSQQAHRGYGRGAHLLLSHVESGADWRDEAAALFNGSGSYGNGAAMRAAPIGAFFARHPARAADEARASAVVTHSHVEGIAGAIAVAVAAALRFGGDHLTGVDYLDEVLRFTPKGLTFDRIAASRVIPRGEVVGAVRELGTGAERAAYDTVPFCIWMVAHHGDDFVDALWRTAGGFGDGDTTCAIVGGILGGSGLVIPKTWRARREQLPTEMDIAAL